MLIWNPMAGRGSLGVKVNQAARVLLETGWNLQVKESKSATHVTELARQAAEEHLRALFVAGGDGSLGRAVAGLKGSETALGVLPTGTANVWARELGLPVSGVNMAVESARRLAKGTARTFDVGMCQGRPFFLWAGFGLDGRVVERLERKRSRLVKQLNEIYYTLTILQCAAGWKGMKVQVKADEQEVEGRFMVGVASNIRLYAGGLAQLSPDEKWDDGRMSLWLFEAGKQGGVGVAFQHVWNLWKGRHVKERNVLCLPFKRLSLRFEEDEWMQMDGEPWGQVKEAEIYVQAQALKVLVP